MAGCWLAQAVCAAAGWETWENCTLAEDPANDGDSMHVRKAGGRYVYVLRLYFVDAPETDSRIPERVAEQAAYWGLSEKDTLELGHKAAAFTRSFLSKPFTVYTRKEDARGAGKKNRYYCLIRSGDSFLCVELLRNGLARNFGRETDPPEGLPGKTTFRLRHKDAENEAKKAKRGAWGYSGADAGQPAAVSKTAIPPVVPQTLTTRGFVPVYSLKDPSRLVATLKPGTRVEVLGSETPAMVRIRYKAGEEKVYEAQCSKMALGL